MDAYKETEALLPLKTIEDVDSHENPTRAIDYFFQDTRRVARKILSREEEQELAEKIQKSKDPEAIQKLIEANLGYAIKTATRYARKFGWHLFEDFLGVINLALVEAANIFQPGRGNFMDIAKAEIRKVINPFVVQVTRITSVSEYETRKVHKASERLKERFHLPENHTFTGEELAAEISRMNTEAKLRKDLGREPSEEEIIKELEAKSKRKGKRVEPQRIKALLEAHTAPRIELDKEDENGTIRHGTVGSTESGNIENSMIAEIDSRLRKVLMEAALRTLDEEERRLVEARHIEPQTKDEQPGFKTIALAMGMKPGHAATKARRAVKKMERAVGAELTDNDREAHQGMVA